jgi:hypothetical protein
MPFSVSLVAIQCFSKPILLACQSLFLISFLRAVLRLLRISLVASQCFSHCLMLMDIAQSGKLDPDDLCDVAMQGCVLEQEEQTMAGSNQQERKVHLPRIVFTGACA